MLCCVLAWMNEYIVQIISATRLWLISRYSHHTLKKRRKMTAKNGHPCTEWFSSLCLQTNRKHMENQALICTRKTSFYTDNITSTLTIVVFSISWSRMFALYVRHVLQTQTENFEQPKNDSIGSESPETSRVFRSMHLHYTTILVFFQRSFARILKNISQIVWYSCNIWRPYKIANILYKTNEKAVSFLSTTSGTSRDLSWVHSFSPPHGVSLFGNIERCVVVSFSGATSVQWSDVEPALCAFSGVCWDYFQVFRRFGCAKWKYCEKWHLPAPKIWNLFLYLAEYSVKNFITTRQYLVNLTCNCWFRMCAQFHQKLISYKCMLFVDCLVVLREYFVNLARVTKL